MPAQLLRSIAAHPDGMSIYCAYADGLPIGSGWTDFPAGSSFPELHGGAVIEAWRGQGVPARG